MVAMDLIILLELASFVLEVLFDTFELSTSLADSCRWHALSSRKCISSWCYILKTIYIYIYIYIQKTHLLNEITIYIKYAYISNQTHTVHNALICNIYSMLFYTKMSIFPTRHHTLCYIFDEIKYILNLDEPHISEKYTQLYLHYITNSL